MWEYDKSTNYREKVCGGQHWGIEPVGGKIYPSFDIQNKIGVSFKPDHFAKIMEDDVSDLFFEIHAENYMGAGGLPHKQLDAIREKHPISLHGVTMSLGGPDRLNQHHLRRFDKLVSRCQPALISEHLAWSTHNNVFYNDLLPLPYTDDTLNHVAAHINEMQDTIKRQILLENPSTYVDFQQSTWSETDFLNEIAKRTGCGLLLDINNVFICATNHQFSPEQYLKDFPVKHVGEIHLAGHDRDEDEFGNELLIDSHNRPVSSPVWDLYGLIIKTIGQTPTLIEWDDDLPEWEVLRSESELARKSMNDALSHDSGATHD